MARTISRDTPLLEITLRKYERPYGLSPREVVRRVCLCLGLLQPGDSRDAIVDIMYVLLSERKLRRLIGAEELARRVISLRKRFRKPVHGVATTNVRRQLARLKELLIVEKVGAGYRIIEWMSLEELFRERIGKSLFEESLQRVQEYLVLADSHFPVKTAPKRRASKK